MKPARPFVPLLVAVSLLTASCGSPPDNASSESSEAQPREEAAASAPTTGMKTEETTSAPEKTAANAAKEKSAEETSAKKGPKPKGGAEKKVMEVKIGGLEYLSGPITVSPGTTVRWVNEDTALHTVTSEDSGGPLASKDLGKGDSYEYTFREPGQYDYYCAVHPFMKSGVTVE